MSESAPRTNPPSTSSPDAPHIASRTADATGQATDAANGQTLTLDEALRLTDLGPVDALRRFGAEVPIGWDVRGIPHGGYLLALVAAAGAECVDQPDPISVAATYLAPPTFGPATLDVEVLRRGRRQSTAVIALTQDGERKVHATATFGHLPDGDPTHPTDPVTAPDLPPPDECLSPATFATLHEEPVRLHQQVGLRLAPDTGWIKDAPRGRAEVSGWLQLADNALPDPFALLVFSDATPPSLFEARGIGIGHVPTLQLTTHLLAKPQPGWISARFATRVVSDSYVDEDGELWDESGRLLATARQLALLVPPRT